MVATTTPTAATISMTTFAEKSGLRLQARQAPKLRISTIRSVAFIGDYPLELCVRKVRGDGGIFYPGQGSTSILSVRVRPVLLRESCKTE
jgi:hypothetical protein